MTRLFLSLLGSFQVRREGEPVTGFESDKVRALLAYLAVEAGRPHSREAVSGLFWPDRPEQAARGNLRHVLPNLRRAIGDYGAAPPFLIITRQTIQFNRASFHWLDVSTFSAAVDSRRGNELAVEQLAEAVDLYQGDFLAGFSLKGCPDFEAWLLLKRERCKRQALAALERLARYWEQLGEPEQACDYAWRQVELEPWREEAQRQLIRLLARNGRRSEALAQYKECRRLLAEEFGVDPAEETTALYQKVKMGNFL